MGLLSLPCAFESASMKIKLMPCKIIIIFIFKCNWLLIFVVELFLNNKNANDNMSVLIP